MRLAGIQQFLKERRLPFQYWEEDDCGSIEFDHRGLHYHIWEFPEPERGAQSNVRSAGRSEEFGHNYTVSWVSSCPEISPNILVARIKPSKP